MKKWIAQGTSGLLVCGLLGAALAATPATGGTATPATGGTATPATNGSTTGGKSKHKAMHSRITGQVISVSGGTLTIQPSDTAQGTSQAISVPSVAKVTQGSKVLTLADLKAGEKVRVTMRDGAVTRVKVLSGGKVASTTTSTTSKKKA